VNGPAENEEFARLIDALNPWLGVAVIIGGWAHRLYRIHPVAQVIAYAPIGTLDTDVAIPAGLRVEGDDLRKRLLANGFEEERLGQDSLRKLWEARSLRRRGGKCLRKLGCEESSELNGCQRADRKFFRQ
jgi:hypothetical protein